MGTEDNKKEIAEPGFIEQANALIDKSYAVKVGDPKYGHGLFPRDHKLLVSIMSLHERHVYDVLVEKFAEKVAEHYDPIMNAIDRVNESLARMDKKISSIQRIQQNHGKRIKTLEENFELLFKEHMGNHKKLVL